MASWFSIPFEIKSMILRHYIRDLLRDEIRDSLGTNSSWYKSGIRVKKQVFRLILATLETREMHAEIEQMMEKVQEEVVNLLVCEARALRALRWRMAMEALKVADEYCYTRTPLEKCDEGELRDIVEYLVEGIQEVVGEWTEAPEQVVQSSLH